MADSPQVKPGVMDTISGLGSEYFGDAIFGDQLDKLIKESPDLAKEILASMETQGREFIDKNGQIMRDALRKSLTLTEKFSLMAKVWVAENLSGKAMEGLVGKDKKVESMAFAETFAGVKEENRLGDKNIYWPTAPGSMGKAAMLWNLKGQVDQGDSTLKFMTGSTLVMPADDSGESVLGLDVTAALQVGLLKHGITLKTSDVKEITPGSVMPGDKEIQLVFAPAEGLPVKADGTVDVDAVKNFAELFKRGQVQWFTNPELMAAVLISVNGTPASVETAMTKFGLSGDEMKTKLNSILPAAPAAAPVAPATPVVPATETPKT